MEKNQNHDLSDKILIALAILYNATILIVATLWLFTDSFLYLKFSLSEKNFMGLNEKVTYGLFMAGVLGGAFYCLRGMYQRLGQAYSPGKNQESEPKKVLNIKVWFFWYLFRPLQGGVLSLILLSLINSHLLVVQKLDENLLSSFYTQISVGFLAGFGSHELIHKIEEIIKVLFAKSKLAGSSSEQKIKENQGN